MFQKIFFIIILSVFIGGCKPKEHTADSNTIKSNNKDIVPVDANQTAVHCDDSVVSKPQQSKNSADFMYSLTDFSLQFFQLNSKKEMQKSFCISPASLELALSLVYAGARNETAVQMSEVLGLPLDHSAFLFKVGQYYSSLKSSENDTMLDFSVANRVYTERTFKLLDTYMNELTSYFGGNFEKADFIHHADIETNTINAWVEEVTRTRIKQLIPQGILNSDTKMVLVNALYFKADWKTAFDESATQEKSFYAGERQKVELAFMQAEFDQVGYAETGQWQVLELPYQSKAFSLLIFLPRQSSASNIHSKVPDVDEYYQALKTIRIQKVRVEIPKFKTESSFSFIEHLQTMGLTLPFSGSADFSGISGNNNIMISHILQKVFFEINEKGSEAAAATAIIITVTSMVPNVEIEIPTFIANRPFIYILKENTYHTPLFIGQFVGI